jgi:hypothetical protein
MVSTSPSASSQQQSDLVISFAAFGVVSLAALLWERRNSSRGYSQKKEEHVKIEPTTIIHPFHPPSKLVGYLKEKGGKKWKHYNEDLEHFVREVPKVELHVHFDGSLDPDFLWHCMKHYDDLIMCLPVSSALPWDPKRPLPVR